LFVRGGYASLGTFRASEHTFTFGLKNVIMKKSKIGLENNEMSSSDKEKIDNNDFVNEKKYERKDRRKKLRSLIILSIVSSFLLVVFGLSWQQSYDLLAYCNAFYFSGFILFFIGWMILMTNMNVLSPVIYGLKTFFLMFAAKKPKLDYYSYMKDRKDNPIPLYIVLTPFIACIPSFIAAIILHVSLG
jgi:hypothetical protein